MYILYISVGPVKEDEVVSVLVCVCVCKYDCGVRLEENAGGIHQWEDGIIHSLLTRSSSSWSSSSSSSSRVLYAETGVVVVVVDYL